KVGIVQNRPSGHHMMKPARAQVGTRKVGASNAHACQLREVPLAACQPCPVQAYVFEPGKGENGTGNIRAAQVHARQAHVCELTAREIGAAQIRICHDASARPPGLAGMAPCLVCSENTQRIALEEPPPCHMTSLETGHSSFRWKNFSP